MAHVVKIWELCVDPLRLPALLCPSSRSAPPLGYFPGEAGIYWTILRKWHEIVYHGVQPYTFWRSEQAYDIKYMVPMFGFCQAAKRSANKARTPQHSWQMKGSEQPCDMGAQ